MHIFSRVMVAIMGWLGAPGDAPSTTPGAVDWADLPTYHPTRE